MEFPEKLYMKQSIAKLLKCLWHHLDSKRKTQFVFLLGLMIFVSFAEVLSIGSVFPFLAVLSSPEHIFSNPTAKPIIDFMGLTSPKQLLLPITIFFCAATFFAGFMRLLYVWISSRLSFAAGADLSMNIYRRSLYQTYAVHCSRNSSEMINGISNKANGLIYGLIVPTLTIVSSFLILIAILVTLLAVNPFMTLIVFGGFSLIYTIVIATTRKKLFIHSQRIAAESSNVIKCLQEGLGGIRDVLIDGNQSVYCSIFREADLPLRRSQGSSFFIAQSPRYCMETLGILLIAILAYSISIEPSGNLKAFPMLGFFALGAQRLLPVLQQAYASWANILGSQASLQDAIELLDQPMPDYIDQASDQKLPFKYHINIRSLDFRYSPHMPYIFRNLNLKISKGSRVGFVGPTGCGKSTLLDIVMGLLNPIKGEIEIDGLTICASNKRAWQAHIAHVPQVIFLSDTTIEENIAFGVPKDKIDRNLVREVAKQAQINDLIESWLHKYNTLVGERGIRLSGGQRQRIGIARALYKQADVIIFDEATSALDSETESTVMEAIEGLGEHLTVLIIAHRVTTLKQCTQIVELSDGGIKRVGSYQQIVGVTK